MTQGMRRRMREEEGLINKGVIHQKYESMTVKDLKGTLTR
jgi:hypothetical protein